MSANIKGRTQILSAIDLPWASASSISRKAAVKLPNWSTHPSGKVVLSPRVCHSHWDGIPSPLQETILLCFLHGLCLSPPPMLTFWSFLGTVSASIPSLSSSPCASFLFGLQPLFRMLLLSPPSWPVSFGSTETDPMSIIISFSHIFLSLSIPPLILLKENWCLEWGPLPNFKVLGHFHSVEAPFSDGGFFYHSPLQ